MKPTILPPHELFTPAEAAPLLRIQTRTLWGWIRTGKIKAGGGHRRLIPASEVARIQSGASGFHTTEKTA